MADKKSLLIVKSETGGLVSAEQFLRNRGWQVLSTTNPSEAITLLAKHQPGYILISVNHPNKKIQGLADTITQTFSCRVIMFSELQDVNSFKMLSDAKPHMVIYPPLTGPAVERAVNKHQKGYTPTVESKTSGSVIIAQRPINTKIETIDESLVMTKNHRESVVFHATREALLKTLVRVESRANPAPVLTNNVVCIAIEGSDCSGYLVIATAGPEKLDEKFIRQLKIYLVTALSKRDEAVVADKDMYLDLQMVPFEDWAMQSAEFLRKSVYANGEVAMAFFRSPTVRTQFQASERSNMCSVGLQYIRPEAVVRCNLYLYLPNNEKYILYTPRGSKIYAKQLENLKQQGVQQMHILLEDTHDFNIYRAEGFLNESIASYKGDVEL